MKIGLGVLTLAACVGMGGQAWALSLPSLTSLVCGALKLNPLYWQGKLALEELRDHGVIRSKDECMAIGDVIGDFQIPTGTAKNCLCNDVSWPEQETTQIVENAHGDPHWIHIDTPEVRHPQTPLMIPVFPGDRVWIMAGGCVQTGGHGQTWERYVHPSGANSGRLYHGQIQIPGVIELLRNLDQIVPSDGQWSPAFTVGATHPNTAEFISLGYTDDGYGDNGYWGHDGGTENQCRGVGNAWLDLYICRANPSHGPTC
jgi:hypothetical protein